MLWRLMDSSDVKPPLRSELLEPSVTDEMRQLMTGLAAADNLSDQARMCERVLSVLSFNVEQACLFIYLGLIDHLIRLEGPGREHQLARLCWTLMTLCCESGNGRRELLEKGVVTRALDVLSDGKTGAVYTFTVGRFIDTCCQKAVLTEALVGAGGLRVLVDFYLANHDKLLLNTMCLPVASALRNACVTLDESGSTAAKDPLCELLPLVRPPQVTLKPGLAAEDPDLQTQLRQIARYLANSPGVEIPAPLLCLRD